MDVRHEHTKIHLGKLQHIFISCFWLGFQFFISSVTMFILPVAIGKMTTGESKGVVLGGSMRIIAFRFSILNSFSALAVGAIVNMISSPLFGAFSDGYQGAI
jgi:hypothetical protein